MSLALERAVTDTCLRPRPAPFLLRRAAVHEPGITHSDVLLTLRDGGCAGSPLHLLKLLLQENQQQVLSLRAPSQVRDRAFTRSARRIPGARVTL